MTTEEWFEEIRPVAWTIPADLVGGEAGDWVKVVRLDALLEVMRENV